MMDFECALRNAFRNCIGANIQPRGCYFHFGQAIYRRIAGERVLRFIYLDREHRYGFYTLVRRIQALAFLPPEQVYITFDQLTRSYQSRHPRLFSVAGAPISNVRIIAIYCNTESLIIFCKLYLINITVHPFTVC